MELSLLENVIVELTEKISGARISKIHQPAADLFIFRLWNGSENLKLLLSAAPGNSRLHLTEQNFANPFTPPRFCQLLRSRISRILTISQLNHDRIVQLECTGPKGLCRLLVELTGRSSNLILVAEDGRIIDALKRVQSSQQRVIAAGQMYVLPEPQKIREVQRKEPENAPPEEVPVSLAVEKLYTQNQRLKKEKDLRGLIEETLKKAQKKLQRRLKNIEQEQVNQQGYEQYKQRGELILANLYQINKGLERIELENYYRQPPMPETIELDPLLNPQKNAEKYFQKYKKARRGLEHSARRLEETRLELDWLGQIAFQLEQAASPADVGEIAAELKSAGILKTSQHKLPRTQGGRERSPCNMLISPGAFKVFWGQNSRQNDQLSTRELKKGDLWFHAKNSPGSHVVLKADAGRGPFAARDISFAAAVAAKHSKASGNQKVEVMVAEAGAVRKPAGSKPGMVTVKQYKSLMVEPLPGERGEF